MKMNDEYLILVLYLNVDDIDSEDLNEYKEHVTKKITPSFYGEFIIIPVVGSPTRMECINPKYITDLDLIRKNEELLYELNNKLHNELNEINKNEKN